MKLKELIDTLDYEEAVDIYIEDKDVATGVILHSEEKFKKYYEKEVISLESQDCEDCYMNENLRISLKKEEPAEAIDPYEKTRQEKSKIISSALEMTDQTAKADAGKLKLSLVPTQIIKEIAKVREYGNNKYPEGGQDNWKLVNKDRYRDAAFRHFVEYINDPDSVDGESGLSHLAHLACNIAFLIELEAKQDEPSTDPAWGFDRPVNRG